MAITECKPKGIFLLTVVLTDEFVEPSSIVSHIADNVLEVKIASANDIEQLLIAVRQYYNTFSAVCFLCSDVELYNELAHYFPEIFQSLIKVPSTEASDAGWFTEYAEQAKALPYFDLAITEPLVSDELKQLVVFFQLDERLTDIAEQEAIADMTQAFIARLSAQRCAFSTFVQIRLLSFFAGKVNKYGDVYFKSLSLKVGDSSVTNSDIWDLVSDLRFTENERYFIYNQVISLEFNGIFLNPSKFSLRFKTYSNLVCCFKELLKGRYAFLKPDERNKELVFIFIAQFLGVLHAPTKIALDMAKDITIAGKQVLIIDTCELLPTAGAIPWYQAAYGNRSTFNDDQLSYQGCEFSYLRLSNKMPNYNEIGAVADLVVTYKPFFTMTIGESLTADICSGIVPNVVLSTTSKLPHSISQFRVIDGFDKKDADLNNMPYFICNGIVNGRVIRPLLKFYSSSNLTRENLGLPSNKFLIAVVGNRLNSELNESFYEGVLPVIAGNMAIVFVGEYSDYDIWCHKYKNLRGKSYCIGYQSDLASTMAVMDVFLNPKRVGGGAGACYALEAGVPILTLKFGDVYHFSGDDFSYENYEEMVHDLIRYNNDPLYKESKSKLAVLQFQNKMSSAITIEELIARLEKSDMFFQPPQLC